jgi:hypothetical protein
VQGGRGGERGEGEILGKIASGSPPSLGSNRKRQRESEGERWSEGGRARVLPLVGLQREEGEKEEGKRKVRVVWPKFN